MQHPSSFRNTLRSDLERFVRHQQALFPADERLVMDLHCHDHHSDVPDELLGRILHWPETWVSTNEVRDVLARNGMDGLTITNHNNARSCWELLERGVDVLAGAEFTCFIPEHEVHIHVLTYGFTPAQEEQLFRLRQDLMKFLTYAREQDLVTILAHPLYFYSTRKIPTLDLLERLTLWFDHFEVLNGQRDTWQNLLMISWLEKLDEERISDMSRRTGIRPDTFCRHPLHKSMTGGSDDHMALFVGTTGSYLHVPNLRERIRKESVSSLALEAMKNGATAAFGSYSAEEKLAASFLDYFCQIVRRAHDPGLIRMMLHQGTVRQKMWSFLIANGIAELRRHRVTSRFIDSAHEALHGKSPGFLQKFGFSREYKPLVKELEAIARTRKTSPLDLEEQLRTSIPAIFRGLLDILGERIQIKVERYKKEQENPSISTLQDVIARMELPADLRSLFGGCQEPERRKAMSSIDLHSLAEGLPFPALAALVIGGCSYTSSKVLFANRQLLDELSRELGEHTHPKRVLWLTDTFADKNGVAGVLRLLHAEALRQNLPIDFAICHDSVQPDDHLHVLKPFVEVEMPFYENQPIRAFDILQLQKIFLQGGYDRIVCSTEGLMGMAALYLKNAFSVPAFFYVHTDWMDFARRTLGLDPSNTDRVRRMLRAFNHGFDGLFLLNSEQLDWVASDAMGFDRNRLRLTAHWPDARFTGPPKPDRNAIPGLRGDERILLFVGRISDEKGVMELPCILQKVREMIPQVRLVVVGTGPAEERLKKALPEEIFIPWVEPEKLAAIYPVGDMLVLPSRFDTFGCVVLEALSCGLPVVAYRTKGPADIIQNGVSGFTVDNQEEFVQAVMQILQDKPLQDSMREAGLHRARNYRPDRIIEDLLRHLGLTESLDSVSMEDGPMPHMPCTRDELGEWQT